MGTEAPKVGAPSKASPVVSGWRQSIWFLEMSVSRVPLEKISTWVQRPLARSIQLKDGSCPWTSRGPF